MSKRAEFARGWPVLIASALGAGTGVAALMFYSMGAFMGPLAVEFGWTREQISNAPLCLSLGMILMGTVIGSIADRFGARRVALFSQLLLIVAVATLSQITANVWTLYLGYFLVGVLGSGTLPIVWSRAVIGWFFKARGIALGLSLLGTGLVGMSLPSYVTWLSSHFGLRGAYVGLAALPLVLGTPLAWLCFREPETAAPGEVLGGDNTLLEALKLGRFWQMASAFFIAALVIGAINVHSISLLTDRGIDRSVAAIISGLLGLTVVFGRLVSGYCLDNYPGSRVAFVLLSIPAGACVLLALAGDSLYLCAAAIILVGLAAGAEHDIAAYFGARYFGRRHYGAIYGLMYTIYTFGAGLGPKLVGRVYDQTGTYNFALYAGAAIFLLAATLTGTLGPYPQQTNER